MIFQVVAGVGNLARDRVAMRAGGWIVQAGDDTGLDRAGDEMFQTAGFFMHLVPLHAQHIDEKTLRQAMTAQHSLCRPDTAFSERDLSFVIHLNEPVTHQPLERFGYGRRGYAELLRQPRPDNRLTFHTDVINRFQIFFHRRAEWFFRFHVRVSSFAAQAMRYLSIIVHCTTSPPSLWR